MAGHCLFGRESLVSRGCMRHLNVFCALAVAGLVSSADGSRDSEALSVQQSPKVGRPGVVQPWDVVFTQMPAAPMSKARALAGGMLRGAYGEGGRLMLLARNGSSRVLTSQFASAADPSVSFDGNRILFAGKKSATDHWDIFEMSADGSALRQITRGLGDCRSPIYQSPIFYLDDPGPMPQIAFVSDSAASLSEYGAVRATAVYSARMDGSGVRRLTYSPSGEFDPTMLPDGRMLFSGWERHDLSNGLRGRIELLATNIDGTDYATFSGGQGSRVKHMACVTARRLVLFVEGNASAPDGAGSLAVISLRRNLHSYRPLALPPVYLYHSPSPLPDGTVLVSRRPAAGGGTHGIFRLDPETGKLDPVFDSPDMHDIQAQALVPRALPDGRSSVVDEKQAWSKLYCLNLHESDLGSRLWPNGSAKRIRLIEGLPQVATAFADSLPAADVAPVDSLSPLLHRRFLGEIDADEDGSFHVQIPANLPLQIQALDENGMALRSSAWIWAKNKEQRGCIGCHEDGERTPENVMARALTRPAVNLMLPPERRRTVEFERDITPILGQRCATAACHGGTATPKMSGIGQRFSAAYEVLMATNPRTGEFRYVTPGAARTSPLVWAVFGRNTSRPWDHPAPGAAARRMPPADSSALSAEEKRALVEWIDLGAHYGGLPNNGGGAKPAIVGGQQ